MHNSLNFTVAKCKFVGTDTTFSLNKYVQDDLLFHIIYNTRHITSLSWQNLLMELLVWTLA